MPRNDHKKVLLELSQAYNQVYQEGILDRIRGKKKEPEAPQESEAQPPEEEKKGMTHAEWMASMGVDPEVIERQDKFGFTPEEWDLQFHDPRHPENVMRASDDTFTGNLKSFDTSKKERRGHDTILDRKGKPIKRQEWQKRQNIGDRASKGVVSTDEDRRQYEIDKQKERDEYFGKDHPKHSQYGKRKPSTVR
jgi:hypothetical protein